VGLSWWWCRWYGKSAQVHCREQETFALFLAIRTVNLKCCDCCVEQKASKDFSSFLKTQNLSDVESLGRRSRSGAEEYLGPKQSSYSVGSGPQGMERNQKRTSWGPPDIQELEV
jgi:hypothetical protein